MGTCLRLVLCGFLDWHPNYDIDFIQCICEWQRCILVHNRNLPGFTCCQHSCNRGAAHSHTGSIPSKFDCLSKFIPKQSLLFHIQEKNTIY